MRHWHKSDKWIRIDSSTYLTEVYDGGGIINHWAERGGAASTLSLCQPFIEVHSAVGQDYFSQAPNDLSVLMGHLLL